MGGEPVVVQSTHRQAATIHRDAVRNSERRRDGRGMDRDTSAVVFDVERFNRSDVFNNSGEHGDSDRSRIRVYSISRPRQKALNWVASDDQRPPRFHNESML